MHRIATAILIAVAVLALNGGMLREAFARDAAMQLPLQRVEVLQPIEAKSAKVLSLLIVLEMLRQSPMTLDAQKV